jgi:hypothetical protein
MSRFVLAGAVAIVAGACGAPPAKLYPSGTERDDGHGELARAATQFINRPEPTEDLFTASAGARRARRNDGFEPGGDTVGFGGSTYANYIVPTWQHATGVRTQHYQAMPNLTGVLEGTITWRGPAPPKIKTTCGAIDGPRIASDGAIADVLVYIERVSVGRPLDAEGSRTASVGGTLTRQPCGFVPAVQIVTPLPAGMYIHGNGTAARVRVTPQAGAPKAMDLHEGGRVGVQLSVGVTKVDAEDGLSAAAWVVAVETPYYALTDDRGRFRIDELANGTYELTVWHAPNASLDNGQVAYASPIVVKRQFKIENGKASRLDVQLP